MRARAPPRLCLVTLGGSTLVVVQRFVGDQGPKELVEVDWDLANVASVPLDSNVVTPLLLSGFKVPRVNQFLIPQTFERRHCRGTSRENRGVVLLGYIKRIPRIEKYCIQVAASWVM